jgi:hypothetical protein
MDSWEDADDDFVPNIPNMPTGNWDDEEEDETLKEEVVAPVELSAAQKALIRKKEEQDELILVNKVKNAQLENETSDQRKVRERKAVEESDSLLADELFDNIDTAHQTKKAPKSSATGSIAAINLSNKQDHVNFGITVATKLENSTAFCVTAFMKEVFTRSQDRLSAEGLDELHAILTKLKDSRKIAEDAKLKDKGKPKSQKAVKAKAKKAKEIFGGEYDYQDDYGDFSNLEDDFM